MFGDVCGTDDQTASEVLVDSSGFSKNLSVNDNTVLKALTTLDALSFTGSYRGGYDGTADYIQGNVVYSDSQFWRSQIDQDAGTHDDPAEDTSGAWVITQPTIESWSDGSFFGAGAFVIDDNILYAVLRSHLSTTTRPAADTTNYLALGGGAELSTLNDYDAWMQALSGDFSAASKQTIETAIWNDTPGTATPFPNLSLIHI